MIKYRTNEFFKRSEGSVFRDERPKYMYDESDDTLKIVGKINIQDELNSSRECALDKILEKYNYDTLLYGKPENNVIIEDKVYDATHHPDLIDYADYLSNLDDWRDRLGVSKDVSDSELFKLMQQKADEIKAHLDDYEKEKEVKSDETKETK